MKAWFQKMTGRKTEEELAKEELSRVRADVSDLHKGINDDVNMMQQKLVLTRAALQQAVDRNAPREELMTLTKKVKHLMSQMAIKQKLLGNVMREDEQLLDTHTNSQVLATMKKSNETQKMMRKVYLGANEDDPEDILDDIDDHREDTKKLTERLAHDGGIDDADIFDAAAFDEHEVLAALGLQQRNSVDTKLNDRIKEKMFDINRPLETSHDVDNHIAIDQFNVSNQSSGGAIGLFPDVPVSQPIRQAKQNVTRQYDSVLN